MAPLPFRTCVDCIDMWEPLLCAKLLLRALEIRQRVKQDEHSKQLLSPRTDTAHTGNKHRMSHGIAGVRQDLATGELGLEVLFRVAGLGAGLGPIEKELGRRGQ